MSGSPVVVRIAVPADLPVLDRELPSGRNDVHAAFLARQATGDATYLVAWRGEVPAGAEHEATEQDRILVHELP